MKPHIIFVQVTVRGSPSEVPLQQTGLQLWKTRSEGSQDPSLVQLCALAEVRGRTSQASIRARPSRRVCQGPASARLPESNNCVV